MKDLLETKNERLNLAFRFVEYTGKNVFLTGKAGTGKTTFLRNLRKVSRKRMVVVAPTGVAAINAGGMTIHSFFQMPFGPIIPDNKPLHSGKKGDNSFFTNRLNKEKISIFRSLDLLVIDEISMVRADLLDGVDKVLRQYRRNSQPFGGVQLLLIGDLQQLAPVVKEEEWEVVRQYYDTEFFFSSRALRRTDYKTIVLEHVYRQSDQQFIDLLNKIRLNIPDTDSLEQLNRRYDPDFLSGNAEGYIILTTHNHKARSINEERLSALPGREHVFSAWIEDEFPEQAWPTDSELVLKKGCQVMFIKNDLSEEKLFYNGKIGRVVEIDGDEIMVQCNDEDEAFLVNRARWENIRYKLDENKELREEITGTFTQFPLKLAWAITIHKSQGLTFEKAIIDARSSFSHGQVYVALSRCRSLEGMVLNSPLSASSIINNGSVAGFTRDAEENPPNQEELEKSRREFEMGLIKEVFSYDGLREKLEKFVRLLKTHQKILSGDPLAELEQIRTQAGEEIFRYEKPFLLQLQKLNQENPISSENTALQKRIPEAAKYHHQKIQNIFPEFLENPEILTDNREVMSATRQLQRELSQEIHVKLKCLESFISGFNLSDFLDARARALTWEPRARTAGTRRKDVSGVPGNSALFRTLINWRDREAEEKDLPAYMVLPVKTIENLAWFAPKTLDELKRIKGIGAQKLKAYGEVLTEIIHASGVEPIAPIPESPPEKKKKKKKKGDSLAETYRLFREGRSVSEIAKERQLARSTVTSHLSKKVSEGAIKPEELMEKEKYKVILRYFEKAEDDNLGIAREMLGKEFSFDELRYVRHYLDFRKQNED